MQPINQLFIAGVIKPENEVQRSGELVIVIFEYSCVLKIPQNLVS